MLVRNIPRLKGVRGEREKGALPLTHRQVESAGNTERLSAVSQSGGSVARHTGPQLIDPINLNLTRSQHRQTAVLLYAYTLVSTLVSI